LQQKIALLKKKYSAKFVNALVEGCFVEDMPYGLVKEFYGEQALKMTGYGRDGSVLATFYELRVGDNVYDLVFMNNELFRWEVIW
jgi:hypothetical protein